MRISNLSEQFSEQMWKPGVTQSSFVLQDPWTQKWEIQILINKASRNIEYLNRHRSFYGCQRYLTMGAQVSWSASPSKWIVLWISKIKKREERTRCYYTKKRKLGEINLPCTAVVILGPETRWSWNLSKLGQAVVRSTYLASTYCQMRQLITHCHWEKTFFWGGGTMGNFLF